MTFFSIRFRFQSGFKKAAYLSLMLASASVSVAEEESRSLLPEDDTARQAAAVAASAVPPERASSDITGLAGEYSYGNSFDINCTLEISPNGRFIYQKCSYEKVVDQASGNIELEDGRIILKPDRPRDTWAPGTSSVLLPISWGQRLYLIPEDDVAGFSNQVNRGIEPVTRGSMGSYYLREGDWDRPATGEPDLPEHWKERLLDKPVTGMVAGRDPSNRWIINLGKDHGVYDGMELSAWSADRRSFVKLIVTETGSDTSAVSIVDAPLNMAIHGWTVHSKVTPPPVPTPYPTQQPVERQAQAPQHAQTKPVLPQVRQTPQPPRRAVPQQPLQPVQCLPITVLPAQRHVPLEK